MFCMFYWYVYLTVCAVVFLIFHCFPSNISVRFTRIQKITFLLAYLLTNSLTLSLVFWMYTQLPEHRRRYHLDRARTGATKVRYRWPVPAGTCPPAQHAAPASAPGDVRGWSRRRAASTFNSPFTTSPTLRSRTSVTWYVVTWPAGAAPIHPTPCRIPDFWDWGKQAWSRDRRESLG